MQIIFGTTNRATALRYLMVAFPSKNITAEKAKHILDLVSSGKIRIGDPLMYDGKVPIFPENNCSKEDIEKINEWCLSL